MMRKLSLNEIVFYIKLMLISSVLVFTTLVIVYLSYNIDKNIKGIIDIKHNDIAMTMNGYMEHDAEEKERLIDAFFDHQVILDYVKNKDRDNFYKAILPFYNKYKSIDSSLWGMHVILNDGMSFIRVHSPKTADKQIRDTKALIKEALETKKLQVGFEVGKYGYFFRVIYPMYLNDEFLGVSEFSYKVDHILDDMHKHYAYNLAFIFKETSLKKSLIDYSKQSSNGYIIQCAAPQHLFNDTPIINKENQIITIEKRIYDIYSFKLPDLQNNSKLIVLNDITSLVNNRKNTLYHVLLFLIIISLVTILFIYYVIKFFSKKIKEREAEAKTKTDELYFNSRHNSLTELPNMSVLREEVKSYEQYSILMLNVNNISIMNTTYGTEIVDIVLKETAHYLNNNIPTNGTLYHMSADEFAIILNKPIKNQEILLSSQIKSYFEQTPIDAKNIETHINFSIGMATHIEDNESDLTVCAKANIALVEAKHRGKGLIIQYEDSMSTFGSYTQLAKNIAILQNDLENDNLTPFYQPIIDNNTKKIFKYEVLARIKDDTSFMSPHAFMETAEVSGLQTVITKQIIQKSFQYFESSSIAFSINITKHDLLENYLENFLTIKTKRHDIDPKNVTLEILEDIAIENNDEIVKQINHLNSLGYVIAIDDFGVESSNISKLSDLNAEFLKIDGSFIKDMNENDTHLHIVESLVFMAKKLDMKIIAEYVHNEEIYELVKSLGIQYSQGYYFSEPKKNI